MKKIVLMSLVAIAALTSTAQAAKSVQVLNTQVPAYCLKQEVVSNPELTGDECSQVSDAIDEELITEIKKGNIQLLEAREIAAVASLIRQIADAYYIQQLYLYLGK